MCRLPLQWPAACLWINPSVLIPPLFLERPVMCTQQPSSRVSRAASVFVTSLLVGCSTGDGPAGTGDQPSDASLSVSFAASGAAATNAAGNAVLVGSANDTLVITKVQLVLGNVKLKKSGVTACPDSMAVSTQSGRSSNDRGCSRLDLGPVLADLPLGGSGATALGVTVPVGTYSEIEFELDDVRTDSRATKAERDFLAANPSFDDITVRVTGTYRGTAFTLNSNVSADVEFEFSPPLEIKAGVNDNVTIALDLARWFKTSTGAIIAPTVANRGTINQNILGSFDAFGDRDRDGKEDEGRGRGRGRGRGSDDDSDND
jgi:hypothetical protein